MPNKDGLTKKKEKFRQGQLGFPKPCREENCEFKTYSKKALERHIHSKHPKEPRIKKLYQCDGCGMKTTKKSRMMPHSKTCLL